PTATAKPPDHVTVRIDLSIILTEPASTRAASLVEAGLPSIRYAGAVHLQTSDDLWPRIEVLARELPGGVIATDGDGTLWAGDVGEDLFHAFLEKGRVEPRARRAPADRPRSCPVRCRDGLGDRA